MIWKGRKFQDYDIVSNKIFLLWPRKMDDGMWVWLKTVYQNIQYHTWASSNGGYWNVIGYTITKPDTRKSFKLNTDITPESPSLCETNMAWLEYQRDVIDRQ